MANELNNKIFQDEAKARKWLEAHLWPDGPICPKCGTVDNATPIKTREGWYQCNVKECRGQFTVTVGTLFERSKIPLNKWLMVAFLMCASKKGISTHQIHRMIGVSYKSTWFMTHRLREAMREGNFPPLGGEGMTVEADETWVGGKSKNRARRLAVPPKEPVFALVERKGRIRSSHVPEVTAKTLRPILMTQVSRKSRLMTDEGRHYIGMGREFARHERVNHSATEYVRGDAHTNTVENYFSILKRGIIGTYHHVSPQHLKRYVAEFDFRYNYRSRLGVNDAERAAKMLKGIVGKRLTYRRTGEAGHA